MTMIVFKVKINITKKKKDQEEILIISHIKVIEMMVITEDKEVAIEADTIIIKEETIMIPIMKIPEITTIEVVEVVEEIEEEEEAEEADIEHNFMTVRCFIS